MALLNGYRIFSFDYVAGENLQYFPLAYTRQFLIELQNISSKFGRAQHD